MSREILRDIINDFQVVKFTRFFRDKSDKFRPQIEDLYYADENFYSGKKIGEIDFEDGNLIICSFQVKRPLLERSGKKAQYELGKKILKEFGADAGIFIFYDQKSNFRFSLIYTNYLGTRRDWSSFRRFTYFVSPELTNKTFLQRIGDGDFSSLSKIKEAFSVEKVTKEFYEKIANWYFWAVRNCRFPKDAEAEENGRNIAVIRLITRIIFVWFMRERDLIPKKLFEEDEIKNILKDISPENSSYYKAILQNLFFATLNTKKEERKYMKEREEDPGSGSQYAYRYQELFKDPNDIEDCFGDIPFLNGGLFECLDDSDNRIYIDGFTEIEEYQPVVPNFLFFSDETDADLNDEYGTKGKRYKVQGLLNILSSYNFTIDENSPDDADIALDPELLGRVFENLLASFNPETSTTARKATGSYYTPREIVDYMVTESLRHYFKTHLPEVKDLDKKLEILFSTESDENPFDESESKKLVELIENVRIVDPAAGSGAFLMGALNKMVFILGKIDPQNELWKEAQLKAAEEIPDPQLQGNIKKQIEDFFKEKNADYGRKLYLIQKCIYGVDIQQIAVEIAKLRFFISLLVDEEVEKSKENWGIEPLPNLDFKIMQGNSLIELITYSSTVDNEQNKIVEQMKQSKEKLFNTSSPQVKQKIRNEIDLLIRQLFEYKRTKEIEKLQREIYLIKYQRRLFEDKKFRQEDEKKIKELEEKIQQTEQQIEQVKVRGPAEHFEWHINFSEVFAEKGGFDIVIANPPYIGEKGHKELFHKVRQTKIGKYYLRRMDYFYFFFHLALDLVKENGIVSFITTNYYLTATGAKKLRQDFKERAIILCLVNFNELKIFESALGQHNMITILKKGQDENAIAKTAITQRKGFRTQEILDSILSWTDSDTQYYQVKQKDLYDGEEYYIRITGVTELSNNHIQKILDKIKSQGVNLGSICNVNQGIVTGADKVSKKHIQKYNINARIGEGIYILNSIELQQKKIPINSEHVKPWFKNSNIYRYGTIMDTDEYVLYFKDQKTKQPIEKEILNHFEKYKDLLIDRLSVCKKNKFQWNIVSKWIYRGEYYLLFYPRNQSIFEGPKIVAPQRSPRNTFGYNEIPWYASADVYFITEKDKEISLKYILALLNSKLYYLWLYYRGKRKGETLELYQKPLSEIPIKKISREEQKPFIEIVDKILAITKDTDYLENQTKQAMVKEYEKQIDQLVYKLYGLTDEEIRIIEGSL